MDAAEPESGAHRVLVPRRLQGDAERRGQRSAPISERPALLRTGRALCIGVDTSERQDALAEADARALADVATTAGLSSSPTLLLGSAATRANVRAQLSEAAAACHAGDLFLLTFSGHGGRDTALAGPRMDCAVRGFCSMARCDDAEMHEALAAFRPGVRVLVISDSCNGGVPADEPGTPPSEVCGLRARAGGVPPRSIRRCARACRGISPRRCCDTWHRDRRIVDVSRVPRDDCGGHAGVSAAALLPGGLARPAVRGAAAVHDLRIRVRPLLALIDATCASSCAPAPPRTRRRRKRREPRSCGRPWNATSCQRPRSYARTQWSAAPSVAFFR